MRFIELKANLVQRSVIRCKTFPFDLLRCLYIEVRIKGVDELVDIIALNTVDRFIVTRETTLIHIWGNIFEYYLSIYFNRLRNIKACCGFFMGGSRLV